MNPTRSSKLLKIMQLQLTDAKVRKIIPCLFLRCIIIKI